MTQPAAVQLPAIGICTRDRTLTVMIDGSEACLFCGSPPDHVLSFVPPVTAIESRAQPPPEALTPQPTPPPDIDLTTIQALFLKAYDFLFDPDRWEVSLSQALLEAGVESEAVSTALGRLRAVSDFLHSLAQLQLVPEPTPTPPFRAEEPPALVETPTTSGPPPAAETLEGPEPHGQPHGASIPPGPQQPEPPTQEPPA